MDECGWDSPKFIIVFGRPSFVWDCWLQLNIYCWLFSALMAYKPLTCDYIKE